MNPLRAAFVGHGPMGATVAEVWQERGHAVSVILSRGDSLDAALGADVAFEFTVPDAAAGNVEALLRHGVPTICGTTGWDPEPARALADELEVPLMVAPNFSIGIAVLRALVAEATTLLAPFTDFDAGIVERHHSRKRDSPSGTARMLAATVAAGGGGEPPMVALRQGGQPGEHRVIFEGVEETLELIHRARSRRVFAVGAVAAAEWLVAADADGAVGFERFLETVRG